MVSRQAHKKIGMGDMNSRAMTRLENALSGMEYLMLNRDTGSFEHVALTTGFLKSLARQQPQIGFVAENDVDEYVMAITKATLIKFLNEIRENKPEGLATDRAAMVFDSLERYSTGLKGDERLLENNRFSRGFVGSEAFRNVWSDIISTSQMLTMTSLQDIRRFMKENGDLDEDEVQSGLPRKRY